MTDQGSSARQAQAEIAHLNRAAEDLWLALQPHWPTLSVEVLPSTASTNAHVMALGRAGACEPTVVVAWEQTAGRGRAGRTWQASAGLSLCMSIGLPLDLSQHPGGGALSLAVGVMAAQALNGWFDQQGLPGPVRLKWPNDLWAMQHKLGGILIEAVASPALSERSPQLRWVVIGLGLNLSGPLEPGLDARTDLARLGLTPSPSPAQAMRALAPALLSGLRQFEASGFAAFQADYAALDALSGLEVNLWRQGWHSGQAPDAHGVAMGVDASGALLIHDEGGQTTPWTIGEVSVRLQTHHL